VRLGRGGEILNASSAVKAAGDSFNVLIAHLTAATTAAVFF
jgi:hypothetical protein